MWMCLFRYRFIGVWGCFFVVCDLVWVDVYLLLLYAGVGCTVWFACSWLFVVWLVCALGWLLL